MSFKRICTHKIPDLLFWFAYQICRRIQAAEFIFYPLGRNPFKNFLPTSFRSFLMSKGQPIGPLCGIWVNLHWQNMLFLYWRFIHCTLTTNFVIFLKISSGHFSYSESEFFQKLSFSFVCYCLFKKLPGK